MDGFALTHAALAHKRATPQAVSTLEDHHHQLSHLRESAGHAGASPQRSLSPPGELWTLRPLPVPALHHDAPEDSALPPTASWVSLESCLSYDP